MFLYSTTARPDVSSLSLHDALPISEAATLTTAGLTAWRALVVDRHLKAGDTVLTMGTGGVSIFALQFAKAMGARVISTSRSEEHTSELQSRGHLVCRLLLEKKSNTM